MKPLAYSLVALAAAIALSCQLILGDRLDIKRSTADWVIDSGYGYEVNLSGKVDELKDVLAKQFLVPRETIHVFWDNSERPGNSNLEECRGRPQVYPHLVFDFDLIKVVKPDGSHIVLAALESDTIANLKKRLDQKENIPFVLQRLMRDNQELHNDVRIASLLLGSGQRTVLKLNLIQTVEQAAQVRVKLSSGELITFRVEPIEQVGSLKDKIQTETGMARDEQILLHDSKGELADDELLLGPGMSGDSILTLKKRPRGEPTIVHVRLASRKLLTFELDLNETVASLKGKISQAEGIPLANQHLYFVPVKELADNARLNEYVTESGSVLHLGVCKYEGQAAHHVHVLSISGDATDIPALEIKPDDTAASIKSRIQSDHSLPQNHTVHLYYEGRELDDDKLMFEHAINNGSTVNLVLRRRDGPEMIHVNLPSGRVVTFNVALSSQVIDLKNYIERAYATFPADRQQIFLDSQELDNVKSLNECNLVSGSTVSLILRPQGGTSDV